MSKIILDLCGGTGSWSRPYREAGYDVRNITLPGYDVRTYVPPDNVYGILAAPPCTMFSLARNTFKEPTDFKQGMEVVIACLNIIWQCQYKILPNTKRQVCLKFWALENPVGLLRRFLGRPNFTFQPYEYGNFWTKSTDLWGYFNYPKKIYKREDVKLLIEKTWEKKFGGTRKADKRAITPAGFAQAFYKANK